MSTLAKDTVDSMPADLLIGMDILTPAHGAWTGGVCTITEIEPDHAAPEIVMQVVRLADGETIGIFEDEAVL